MNIDLLTGFFHLLISIKRAFITNMCRFISFPPALIQYPSDPLGSRGLSVGLFFLRVGRAKVRAQPRLLPVGC